MGQAYSQARNEGKKPVRWRINRAALQALYDDIRLSQLGSIKLEDKPLFGAPITLIDDRNDQPTFHLSTEVDD